MSLAILMAMLYLKSGSLITPISFHAAINFITMGIWNELPNNATVTTLFYSDFSHYLLSPATVIFALVTLFAILYLGCKSNYVTRC